MNLNETKSILNQIWNNVSNGEFQSTSDKALEPIINNLQRLSIIYKSIQNVEGLISNQQRSLSKLQFLNIENLSVFNYEKVTDDIAKKIYEAYFLTEQILYQLNLIDKVNYVISYNSVGGNVYYRSEGQEMLEFGTTVKYQLVNGVGRLKLQSQTIAKKFKKQDVIPELQKHYQDFIAPLKKAKHFYPGYATEAFERHWEEMRHSIEHLEKLNKNEFSGKKNERRVWRLYIESMGRDAYYTGPDTALSQVKRHNASLISDINTVLRVMETILSITGAKGGQMKWSTKLSKELKSIFSPAKGKPTLTQKQLEALNCIDSETKQMLQKYFLQK